VLGKWICQPKFKFFPTTICFLPHFIEIMAQSTRASEKIRRKGRNSTVDVAPHPPNLSPSISVTFVVSGATSATSDVEKNIVVEK
jgi:hypothetical protein